MSKGPWKHKPSVTRSLLAFAEKENKDLLIDKDLHYRLVPKTTEIGVERAKEIILSPFDEWKATHEG